MQLYNYKILYFFHIFGLGYMIIKHLRMPVFLFFYNLIKKPNFQLECIKNSQLLFFLFIHNLNRINSFEKLLDKIFEILH